MSDWWRRPRTIAVVNDTDGWMTPFCHELVDAIHSQGDEAWLTSDAAGAEKATIAFYLGCTRLTPPELLRLHKRNLVVHASDLPKGRGFSPLKYAVESNVNDIPVCLFEATNECDAGDIYFREVIHFEGHELLPEMQRALGRFSNELCLRYLSAPEVPLGIAQIGEPTYFSKRTENHQILDPHLSIAANFNRLRVADNVRFPAIFDHRGHRYVPHIHKLN